MMILPGDLGIRKAILDVLADLPPTPGNRLSILRILWDAAAGSIISAHGTIRSCRKNGGVLVEVDDPRWIPEIRHSSGIIIERINRMLMDLQHPEYAIRSLEIIPALQTSAPQKQSIKKKKIAIPDEILEKAAVLSEPVRKVFLEWYQAVASKNQSEN